MSRSNAPVSQTRRNVALLLDNRNLFGREVFRGIIEYAQLHPGWSVIPCVANHRRSFDEMRGWKGDGIIAQIYDASEAKKILETGVRHCVNVSNKHPSQFPVVSSCNASIGTSAADYYLARNIHNLGYYGPSEHTGCQIQAQAMAERASHKNATFSSHFSGYGDLRVEADRGLMQWIAALPRPVGVLAFTHFSERVLFACRNVGLRVPADVAVLGISEDTTACQAADPQLSTILLPMRRIGIEAARLLEELMSGKPAPNAPLLFPPSDILTRRSSDLLTSSDPIVTEAIRYIDQHIDNDLTVEDLLGHLNISRRSLEQRFRKALGFAPREQIRRAKIERARKLLCEPEIPLADVAAACGMRDISYLGRWIKKSTGLTPTQFREHARQR